MTFATLLAAASIAAGAIASVAGFGIGTVLTPVFAVRVDMKLAVAAVAVTADSGPNHQRSSQEYGTSGGYTGDISRLF